MNIIKIPSFILLLALFGLSLQSCGGEDTTDRNDNNPVEEAGLSDFELEHGIGPITEHMEINDEIDEDLVIKGRNIFEMKCEMCHNMEGRMVGPPLGDVTDRRTPEYIMNFILNPTGMVNDHPVGQELLREYFTGMPFQNVEESEARAIVEFLRDYEQNN